MSGIITPTQEKTERLLSYLAKKIGEHKPHNVIFFIVDILCTYYPQHITSFSKIWLMDKALDEQKQHVRELFRRNNSTSGIAQHFINAGFDSLDALAMLNTDVLDEIQAYNNTTWLPGHKVKLFQIFKDIKKLVKEYKDELNAQRIVWNYSETPIYQQTEGTYIKPKTITNVKMDGSNTISRPASVYYYPQVQTSGSVGYMGSPIISSSSPVLSNQSIISQGDRVYVKGISTVSNLGGIPADAIAAHVNDVLMTKAENDNLHGSVTGGRTSCCSNSRN